MPIIQTRRRLLTTASTKSAYALTAGMYTLATLAAALGVTEAVASEMIVPLGPTSTTAEKRRGLEVVAFGTGADNATMEFRVWQLKRGSGAGMANAIDFELTPLYTVACVLSTAVGAASGTLVLSTERLADAMTVTALTAATTPPGQSSAIETAYGAVAAAAYSPAAGNTPARFYLPDVGGGDVLIEPIVGTATGANALVEGQT